MTILETLLTLLVIVGVARVVVNFIMATRIVNALERLTVASPLIVREAQVDADGNVKVVIREPEEVTLGDGDAEVFDEPTEEEFLKNNAAQKDSHGIVEVLGRLFKHK